MVKNLAKSFSKIFGYFLLELLAGLLGTIWFWLSLFWLLYLDTWLERIIYIGITVFIVYLMLKYLDKRFPHSYRD